ncbi:hypothetical protein THICB2_420076 [Thiomonas sp. CB2]|nr:hypothetical protein THICB2_420076 [Thiomonas sp. CB2]VDY04706.1 protein of unknown function [Thiomonas sp. Bio17B3]
MHGADQARHRSELVRGVAQMLGQTAGDAQSETRRRCGMLDQQPLQRFAAEFGQGHIGIGHATRAARRIEQDAHFPEHLPGLGDGNHQTVALVLRRFLHTHLAIQQHQNGAVVRVVILLNEARARLHPAHLHLVGDEYGIFRSQPVAGLTQQQLRNARRPSGVDGLLGRSAIGHGDGWVYECMVGPVHLIPIDIYNRSLQGALQRLPRSVRQGSGLGSQRRSSLLPLRGDEG